MRLLDVMENTTRYFAKHGVESPRLTIELMLAEVLKKTRMKLYVEFETELSDEVLDKLRPMVKARAGGEPLEYILGFREFDGHRFRATPDVLVPRYETELLLQAAVPLVVVGSTEGSAGSTDAGTDSAAESAAVRAPSAAATAPRPIIDVGTGSGIMGISLARRFPTVPVFAFDISEKALAVARGNAEGVPNISFHHSDLLSAWPGLQSGGVTPQLIVANLPYIPTEQIATLSREVQREPHLALDGGADGLDHYRTLAPEILRVLKPGGRFAVEIGYDQKDAVEALFRESGALGVTTIKDLSDRYRVVAGTKKALETAG